MFGADGKGRRTERQCDEDGCTEKHFGRGKCKKHHQRLLRARPSQKKEQRRRQLRKSNLTYREKKKLEKAEQDKVSRMLSGWKRPAGMDEVLRELT